MEQCQQYPNGAFLLKLPVLKPSPTKVSVAFVDNKCGVPGLHALAENNGNQEA